MRTRNGLSSDAPVTSLEPPVREIVGPRSPNHGRVRPPDSRIGAAASSPAALPAVRAGLLSLAGAGLLALVIQLLNLVNRDRPEWAVGSVAIVLAVLAATVGAGYLLAQRSKAEPGRLGLLIFTVLNVALAAIYLYWASAYVRYPADVLIWSESDFVNDILKFRIGYPLYTADVNNESFVYPPGAQLLTYFLAWLSGNPTSIPAYRVVQVGYTALAAIVAAAACRRLVQLTTPARQRRAGWLWGAALVPFFFLLASNSISNPFVYLLHNDALAQLLSALAYWLLLAYVGTRDWRLLAPMAVLPAAGFMVKQSLAVWAIFYCLQLAVFDSPRTPRRLLGYALAAFGLIGLTLAGCYWIWGNDYLYWTVTVLGKHDVSPLRGLRHVLTVWTYAGLGLLGGALLLRGPAFRLLLGPWLIWLAFFTVTAYTSGIAWMLNHLGPSTLIAGIWFAAGLYRLWLALFSPGRASLHAERWLRAGVMAGLLMLLTSGLGIVRVPLNPLSDDAYRYKHEIEREFDGVPASSVLLDVGTWVYLPDGVVMKDRAPTIGERGYSQTGDLSGILQRLRDRQYAKLLVRNLHSPDFWYDHFLMPRSTQIRQAIQDNYREVGRIAGVSRTLTGGDIPYGLSDLTVLVPRSDTERPTAGR